MGLEASQWFQMYAVTHEGTKRLEWPDGGCYLKQLQIVVDMWTVIIEVIQDYRKEKDKR